MKVVVHGKMTEWGSQCTRITNRSSGTIHEACDRKRDCHIYVERVRRLCSLYMPQLKLGAETERAVENIFCNNITYQYIIITTTTITMC